jgi:perosamine synthetase
MKSPAAGEAAPFAVPNWPGAIPEVEAAVLRALRDGQWGQYEGEYLVALCERLAERFKQQFVTLCSSGTIAVELGLRGLGVDSGQEVILSGYDFPGNFRAIEAVGAVPVVVDLPKDRYALALDSIAGATTEKTSAVIISHLHGSLAPIAEILEWCNARGVRVIEDACQCPGAEIKGLPAGSFGDAAVLSFGGSKLLTAGRGGAVLTSNERVHQRIKVAQDRGNLAYPLSQLQAAALLPQLQMLDGLHRQRQHRARRFYERLVKAAEFGLPAWEADGSPAFYKVPFTLTSRSRDSFCLAAQQAGIPLFPGFRGFTTRSARRCRVPFELVNSRQLAAHTVLLHHAALLLADVEIARMADTLCSLVRLTDHADTGDE